MMIGVGAGLTNSCRIHRWLIYVDNISDIHTANGKLIVFNYSCDLAFLTWVWCEKAEVMMLEVTQETHGRHPFHSINVLHVMAPGSTFYLTRLTTPYNAWQNLTCNVRTLYCISWHQQSYGTLWWPGDTIHCAKRSTTEHCGRVLCAPQKYRQPKFYIVPSP